MTIVKTVDIPDSEIEEIIVNEIFDSAFDTIENYLRENYNVEEDDLKRTDYIFFLNIMKEKIDERIAYFC